MTSTISRREALKASLATAAGFAMPRATEAQSATGSEERIPVNRDIEPLVRLLEDTPQDKLIPLMADKVAQGLPYRQLLAAVFMKKVRGTSSHGILVVHAVHQTGMDVGREDRLLPLLWAGPGHLSGPAPPLLSPLRNSSLPSPDKAKSVLEGAMESGDSEAARNAIVALARSDGPRAAMDDLWRWGAIQCGGGNIGHSAIAVSNTYRTLEVIGWHHAEPVLQFLVNRSRDVAGKNSPRETELNLINARRASESAGRLRPDWAGGASERSGVLELLTLFRDGNQQNACARAHAGLVSGKMQAATVWDAILLATAELVVRYQLGGVTPRPLHSVTTSNALHYAFRTCVDTETRFYLLLQAVHWACAFYAEERFHGHLRNLSITAIPEVAAPASVTDAVDDIFALLPPRRFPHRMRDRSGEDRAMELTYALANKHPHASFVGAARQLLCRKADDAHDWKFPAALFENYEHVSPEWRPHLLAASVHVLPGTEATDSPRLLEAREELRRLKK